ncbi:MAG: M23 family metallopeptidase [Actinomycetota bacterium]|nr:M23 family metallopeptidase [Actinomycetota bacterium]MDP2288390.1 M23 family metallopeptidase [Actinomycetota bacterium]
MILFALVTILSQWLAPIPGAEVLLDFAPAQQRWSAGHRGVDFAAETGTSVAAIGPGTVVFAGIIAGKPVISIEHPELGLRSTYEPVTGVVRPGDVVRGGQLIGSIARVGGHCADRCLHLGLKDPRHGQYRDPLALWDSRYAVLKPLSD